MKHISRGVKISLIVVFFRNSVRRKCHVTGQQTENNNNFWQKILFIAYSHSRLIELVNSPLGRNFILLKERYLSNREYFCGMKQLPVNRDFNLFIVKCNNSCCNIASRAAQSNSVYISVLKISLVHADSVNKSLRQDFFFAQAAIVSWGKILYFATTMDTNKDSAYQSQNKNLRPFLLGQSS